MFSVFANAWKVKAIRDKLLYVLLILLIYRLGTHIPLPGLNLKAWQEFIGASGNQASNLYAIIAGGGIGTIFAMGIGPYITASIIMQLLTVAIPKLEQIQKEGEEGRKKINQYTRVVAVVLAFIQAGGTVLFSLKNLFVYQNVLVYLMATIAMVTGTIFIMWLSELLTEKGIGNGSSFIIFANILSGLPRGISSLYVFAAGGDAFTYISIAIMLIIFVGIVAFVVLVQDGERRIPVQYSKKMVGKQFGGSSSAIPIKVNIAGVMSIIFAISLLQFPTTIDQFVKLAGGTSPVLDNVVKVLSTHHPVGAILYVILIFCFTFFYTSFAVNPIEMAEGLKKNGGFIPGIRPGKPTSDYIQKTVDRMSWIGALVYAIIAMIPIVMTWIFKIPLSFGGTTLLIVTGVALDIVKQLESQLLMRHHRGFLS